MKNLITKREPMVFDLLRNDKDKKQENSKSGVYQIPMNSNGTEEEKEFYIGITERCLEDRIKEHKYDIKNGNMKTALAKKFYESSIDIKWEESIAVRKIDKNENKFLVETIEILKREKYLRLINDKQSENVSSAWNFAVNKL